MTPTQSYALPRSVIFWKWSDGDLEPGAVLDQIDDLCRRSTFQLVAVGLEHTTVSFDSNRAHAALAAAAERLASHGRGLVLSIDPRQEPNWAARMPDHCLGWVDSLHVGLDDPQGVTWTSAPGAISDHFGHHPITNSELLAAFAYQPENSGAAPERVDALVAVGPEVTPGRMKLRLAQRPGWRAVVFVVHWLSYPDVFSDAVFDRHLALLDRYTDVPIAGAAVDEWGTVPQPRFRFERAWADPWWSPGLVSSYADATGRDLLTDLFRQQVTGHDTTAQTSAIVDYYAVVRDRTVAFETLHYEASKERFGDGCFVGFHPTWWGVDEAHQASEVFKNGFNWWTVRRDVAQTDEVVPMGVRLALARKAGRPAFFNMWYSMGSQDVTTYVQDAWRNARYGGRTTHLGYRCEAERWAVLELAEADLLEQVSAMEDRIGEMAGHVDALVDSAVLVVVGWAAAVDWRRHVDTEGQWNFSADTLTRGYAVLRGLWDAGFIAEFVPDYEELRVEAGAVVWCGHAYAAAVFVDAEPPADATRAASVTTVTDAVEFVRAAGAVENDVPWGCRLEDGTVLVAAPDEPLDPIVVLDFTHGSPPSTSRTPTALRPTGNPIDVEVMVDGRRVQVVAEDFVVIGPEVSRVAAGRLHRLVVDGEDVTNQWRDT